MLWGLSLGILVALGVVTLERGTPERQPTHTGSAHPLAKFSSPPTPAPILRDTPPASPPNGTILYRDGRQTGLSELSIDNGTKHDAVVGLIGPGRERHVWVYVHARHAATIRRIAPGTYRVHFKLGTGWLGREFAEREGDFEFVDPLEFREETHETEEGRRSTYATWSVSLHPVVGGTARTTRVPAIDLVPAESGGETVEANPMVPR